jgi:hypothetical protein
MYYRLAALPPAWMESRLFLIEDRIGRLYMFDPADRSLERVEDSEASALMLWYDLSQAHSWYSRAELTLRISPKASHGRITPRRDRLAHSN